MRTVTVPIMTYGGTIREVKKVAIFAETDPQGRVFYKIEGQEMKGQPAIAFTYDLDKAIEDLATLAKDVLRRQTEKLIQKN